MLRVYRLPNGKKYRFADGEQPDGAVCVSDAVVDGKPGKAARGAAKNAKGTKKAK